MTAHCHNWMTSIAGAIAIATNLACARAAASDLSERDREAIADTIRGRLVAAYTLSGDSVSERLMSIYPAGGVVISASGGRVTASRDTLEAGVRSFWEGVGQYMQDPRWEWGPMHVDVLTRDAAILTTTYVVPHTTPEGERHVIGGAWTSLWKRVNSRWVVVREHLSDMPRPAAERIERAMNR
ncbi:MAG: DUF4440 domain-containing protein [Gemmatimonadaceae bacterium]